MNKIKESMELCEREIARLNELKDIEIGKLAALRKELWKMEREE